MGRRGVKILRSGKRQFEPLNKGDRLQEGDLIALTEGDQFVVESDRGLIKAGQGKRDKNIKYAPQLMIVSGEKTLAPLNKMKRPQREKIDPDVRAKQLATLTEAHSKGPWRWGAAGRPITTKQRLGYVGPEEALYQQWLKNRTADQSSTNQPKYKEQVQSQSGLNE